jgi:hypothetical protein
MGDVVNLNQFRKEQARAAEKRAARENRAKFGRSGNEKRLERAEEEKARRDMDGKKRDPAETPEDRSPGAK